MKVLVVCDVLGEENNGTTIAAMNLIRYLKAQGDEVRVLCADQDKKDFSKYFVVPNLHLGFIIDYIVKKNCVTLSKPDKKIILKALDGVDIVHVMIPFPLGIKTIKLAKQLGIPVTAGFHCQAENFSAHLGMMNSKWFNKKVYKYFYNHCYKYVDAIHYPTQFIRDIFETSVKRNTNGYVISNGVNHLYTKQDVIRKGKYAGKFNVLFIGRISKEKSHHLLVKAVAKSRHKDDIQLIFAGQGPREEEIRNLAKRLKINKPIIKFFSRKKLVEVINSTDLYVHPAEIEIEAISCLEAITCGLVPVINNSPKSATKYFALDEKNLFDFNDVDSLAEKIDYWYEHRAEKEVRSKEYLNYTTKFEQDNCMYQMREMLKTYASNPLSHTSLQKYYYRDERNDDFANDGVVKKHNKPGYVYVNKSPFYKVAAWFMYYIVGKPIVIVANKLFIKQKLINKKILRQFKDTGYFVYANHTSLAPDAFAPNLLAHKKNYIIVGEETTSITGIKTLVKMFGAIPLPSNIPNTKSFLNAVDYRSKNDKAAITIYPEAHIWPGCTFIRDFPEASFRYPVDLNVPCFVITNTYQQKKHSKKVKMVSYVSGPYYPNQDLERRERIKDLRNQVYNEMLNKSKQFPQVETVRYIKLEQSQNV